MKIMVTGGAGYIGSVVSAHLVAAGHEVVVLDDLTTGHADAVKDIAPWCDQGGSVEFIEAGIESADGLLDPSYDAVMHFAARSQVGESAVKPELYWQTNVVGTLALLDAMRDAGVGRLVFSSTAAVYGEPQVQPITEDAPPVPVNTYGATKLAIDHVITSYVAAHGLAATSLRYFNVTGALRGVDGGDLAERHDPETHLIPRLLLAARDGTAVSVFGTDYPTRDGTAVRDYLHVADLAEAHLAALDHLQEGRHAIYNLGTSTGSTVREVIAAVETVSGRTLQVVEEGRRAGDPVSLVASPAKAAAELGWVPRRSLQDAVADAWAAL